MNVLFSLLLLAAPVAPATEEQSSYMERLEACVDAADGTSYGYVQCYKPAIDSAKAEMQSLEEQLAAKFADDEGVGKSFAAEQAAWKAYQETACGLYWEQPYFGSMHRSIIGPRCQLLVIRSRIEYLQSMAFNFDDQ